MPGFKLIVLVKKGLWQLWQYGKSTKPRQRVLTRNQEACDTHSDDLNALSHMTRHINATSWYRLSKAYDFTIRLYRKSRIKNEVSKMHILRCTCPIICMDSVFWICTPTPSTAKHILRLVRYSANCDILKLFLSHIKYYLVTNVLLKDNIRAMHNANTTIGRWGSGC